MKVERFARGVLAFGFLITLWSELTALGPSRAAAAGFSSDSAVPVLMANDGHWDLFRLYFYGQDRFGAWPFGVAHCFGRLWGFAWTPDSLHAWLALWLVSGTVAAALLSRKRPAIGGAAFLLAIGLPGITRNMLSDLAQPYAWQLPALLWAWWSLRAWVGERWRGVGGALAVGLLQLLAIWISTLSVPMLVVLALLELWRLRLEAPRAAPAWPAIARALIPVALGTGAELLLRSLYHRAATARFGGPYLTHLHPDWGHFAANAAAISHRLLASDCWPALAVATLGGGLAAWLLLRSRPPIRSETLDLGTLTLGLSALALLPIPVLIGVSHVRENLFDQRYFTPTLCFGRAAAFAAVALAVAAFVPRDDARAWGQALLAAGAVAILVALRPLSLPNPAFERQSRIAAALRERAPGSPLVNGYWGSYPYAALAPPGALVALPTEGDYNRNPFDLEKLRAARDVVVGSLGPLAPLVGAPWLWEYGVPLRLREQALFSDGGDSFALYENARASGLPFQAAPANWQLGTNQPALELRFAPVHRLTVLVERSDLKAATPAALAITSPGIGALSVQSEGMPRGFEVRLGPSDQPFSTLKLASQETVHLEGLLLLAE